MANEIRYFQGEREAIAAVVALADQYGYGNLIARLSDAWSAKLQRNEGLSKNSADLAARHVCVWCGIDSRTGKLQPGFKREGGFADLLARLRSEETKWQDPLYMELRREAADAIDLLSREDIDRAQHEAKSEADLHMTLDDRINRSSRG